MFSTCTVVTYLTHYRRSHGYLEFSCLCIISHMSSHHLRFPLMCNSLRPLKMNKHPISNYCSHSSVRLTPLFQSFYLSASLSIFFFCWFPVPSPLPLHVLLHFSSLSSLLQLCLFSVCPLSPPSLIMLLFWNLSASQLHPSHAFLPLFFFLSSF